MNDTSNHVSRLVAERHRAMSSDERVRAAVGMHAAARAIVESSLPAGLSPVERRLAIARRFYGREVSGKVLLGYAWHGKPPGNAANP